MTKRKTSKIDRDLSKMINSLSDNQMAKVYEIIDGPIPEEIKKLTDEELLAALSE